MITVIVGSQLRHNISMSAPVLFEEDGTVAEVVSSIDERYPGFRDLVVSSRGVRANIKIKRRSDSEPLNLDSVLEDGDTIDVTMADIPRG